MTDVVTPFPKERQAAKSRGKPDLEKAKAELEAEPTVQSEAAERVAVKRAARVAAAQEIAEAIDPRELPLSAISHGENPREHDPTSASDKVLAESVRQHGVLQPIRVRPVGDGQFTIVAGHRRFEAAKVAKLKAIPVVVAMVDDQTAFVQALVENLQREDLNPLDEAEGFRRLIELRKAQAKAGTIDDAETSQAAVGKLVGRSQPYVANAMRLLTLEPEVREGVESGKIPVASAKALASLAPERQKSLAKQVESKQMRSKDVEEAVRYEKERQKADEARQALYEAQTVKAVSAAEKVLVDNPEVGKDKLVIWTGADHLAAALTGAGFTVKSDGECIVAPPWQCDCQSTNVEYDDWRGFRTVCVVDQHEVDYRKQRDAERRKANEAASKKLSKARGAVTKHLKSDEGLTIDGQRVALYLCLTSNRGYGYDASTEAFVKRHGGAPRTSYSGDYGDVWEVVQGLTPKDLAVEFAGIATGRVIPNVWSENGHGTERDWKLREYLAEQKVIESEAVYGPGGVPETVKKSEKDRFARAALAKEAEKPEQVKAEIVEIDGQEAEVADPAQPVN